MDTLKKLLFWKAAGGGSPLYERTIINNPAVFTTEVAKPLKGLLIPFLPVQSGTGDPSPSNIRTITGWTGLNIYRSGEDTSDPLTIPVSWQSEAGEVYGGTLDALTGVLMVQYEIESITWGSIKRTGGSGYDYGYLEFTHGVKYQGSGASASNSFCNVGKYVYAAEGYGSPHFYIGLASAGNIVRGIVYLPMETDENTPIQIVGELIDPYTVQLDPVSLSTLIGENVIWTDTNSDNTIKYLSKTQGGGLGGGFGGGFGSGSDDPGDPENPDDPIDPDDPIEPDDPEIPEEPVTDE